MEYSRTASDSGAQPYSLIGATAPGPGAPFPPTLFFILGLALGWLFEGQVPLVRDEEPREGVVAVGWVLTLAGAALFFWGLLTFARARTGIMLQSAATRVVVLGPYRWSRNPQYVAFTLAYIGVSLVTGLVWPFLLLPIVLAGLTTVIIAREERYMRTTFGPSYFRYCSRVRRWL